MIPFRNKSIELFKLSENLSSSRQRDYRDDDFWLDRLCHRYSVIVFSVFAVLVTAKSYIGDPIDCWAPPEFKTSYERYAETLCFINGTYYISPTEMDVPIDPNRRYSNPVRYYQWTPFILLLQAVCMYLPRIMWVGLNHRYGISLKNLIDAAKKYESVDLFSNKEKILIYMCKNLLRTLQLNQTINGFRNQSRLLFSNTTLNTMVSASSFGENDKASDKKKNQTTGSSKYLSKIVRYKHNYLSCKSDLNGMFLTLNAEQKELSVSPTRRMPPQPHHPMTSKRADLLRKEPHPRHTPKKQQPPIQNTPSSSSLADSEQHLQEWVANNKSKKYFLIDNNHLDYNFLLDYLNSANTGGGDMDNYRLNSSMHILHDQIRSVSKKHLLNILSNGYEATDYMSITQSAFLSPSTLEETPDSTPNSPKPAAHRGRLFYVINNKILSRILQQHGDSLDIKKQEEEEPPHQSRLAWSSHISSEILKTNYLTLLYLWVKLAYLMVCIGQVVLLNRLLNGNPANANHPEHSSHVFHHNKNLSSPSGSTTTTLTTKQPFSSNPSGVTNTQFYMIGLDLIKSFWYDIEWPHLPIFPRISICEIYIREVGTVHPYLIQCVLRINIFNELIFILVWHWLLFVIVLTAYDFVARLFTFLLRCSNCERKLFALKYLELIHLNSSNLTATRSNASYHQRLAKEQLIEKLNDKYLFVIVSDKTKRAERKSQKKAENEEELNLFDRFCQVNFNNDTIFALRLIEQNASSLIVSEIIEHMWLTFKYVNLVHSFGDNDYLLKKLIVLKRIPANEKELEASHHPDAPPTCTRRRKKAPEVMPDLDEASDQYELV